jgi:hypothetical protein
MPTPSYGECEGGAPLGPIPVGPGAGVMLPPTLLPPPPIAGDVGLAVGDIIGFGIDDDIAPGDFIGFGDFVFFIFGCFMPDAIGEGAGDGDGVASAACDRASTIPAVVRRRFMCCCELPKRN